jgi:hypothetical protein
MEAIMEFTKDLHRKVEHGDPLSDAELEVSLRHYQQTAALLSALGPKFHLAFVECERRERELKGFVAARARRERELKGFVAARAV